jgi:hypothetical protein
MTSKQAHLRYFALGFEFLMPSFIELEDNILDEGGKLPKKPSSVYRSILRKEMYIVRPLSTIGGMEEAFARDN